MPLVRVATYNLLSGVCLDRGGIVDLRRVAASIAALEADVVAVQEVDRHLVRSGMTDQVAQLAELLGWHGVFAPALLGDPGGEWRTPVRDRGSEPGYGVGILSRHTLGTARTALLPGGGDGRRRPTPRPTRPGWDREPRTALCVPVETPDGWVAVTTTHLSYLPWRGLHQLLSASRLAGSGEGPAVLAGDLNLGVAPVRAFLPSWRHAGGGPTYPAAAPRVQLDQVLVRGDVEVRAAWARPETTSDHRPLVTDLVLRPSASGA